eukprot:XP_001695080.1 predicted protein [Chlamydomonas reinhardtii]
MGDWFEFGDSEVTEFTEAGWDWVGMIAQVVRRPLWDPRATLAAASPAPVLEAMKESPTPPVQAESSSGGDENDDVSSYMQGEVRLVVTFEDGSFRRFSKSVVEDFRKLPVSGCLVLVDVKPANMLHRADDTYCLADFGLAEQLSPADPTGTFFFEMACGTRHYMAPEVQSNVPLTAAVDVYSFGITALCVAVTGSNSAAADWFAQQSWWPAGDAPAAARAFPAGIFPSYLPLSLELLLLDCVAWDPQERPTAEQVVQRLAAIWEEVVVCGY